MRLLFALLLCVAAQAAPEMYMVLPTGSMKPTFDERHFIFVEATPFADIKVGDIILFQRAKPFAHEGREYDVVVHRVWRRSSGGRVVITKGDACDLPDQQLITEADYRGKVVGWVLIDDYWKPGSLMRIDKAGQVGQP